MIAHNGSGFDSYVVLKKLHHRRSVVKLIENGADIISLKVFNGYVGRNKKIPQYLHFRFGRVHVNDSLKKKGERYKLQPWLLKQ